MRCIYFIFLFVFCYHYSFAQLRHALLIGNGAYANGPLRNPVNDVQLLSGKLADCGFKVTTRINLNSRDFKKSIDSFFTKIQNTRCEALFFYSGHAIQHEGENYLIPVNAILGSEADVEEQCVKLQFILNKLFDAKTKTNIVILDACRNDPFSKSWSRGEPTPGLAGISRTPPQSFIAYATAPLTKATDGKGTNSPYSAALAKYLTQPGLTIFQIFQKVLIEVKKQNPNQTPWNNYSLESDYYFIPNRDYQPGSLPMSFLISEDCYLLINEENKGKYQGGQEFTLDYPAGLYKIRAISQHDSTIYYDTVYNYNPHNSPADNLMYIPLNNKILNIPLLLKPLLDSIRFNMVRLDGGVFNMGNKSGNNDETPSHKVNVNPYHISKYEVTQRQWQAIMGNNPSINKNCMDCPVENISWEEANEFIRTLNFLTDGHYRLPTEAEWEFAAGGGNLSFHFLFSGNKKLEKVGWFYENAGKRTHTVGTKASNESGLADMSGNVAEWCADWYDASYYRVSVFANPQGPGSGRQRVIRGGSWDDYDQLCRIFSRNKKEPDYKNKTIGFRIAR